MFSAVPYRGSMVALIADAGGPVKISDERGTIWLGGQVLNRIDGTIEA